MLISLLRHRLRPYRGLLVAVAILQLAGTLASLWLPALNASIIDRGVVTGDLGHIWRFGALMLVVSLVQVSCAIAATRCGALAAMSMGRELRSALFGRVLGFSSKELNEFGAPSLITRNTNDVQQVQLLVVLGCTMLATAPITMVGGVVMALREDPGLTLVLAVAVPLLAVCIWAITRQLSPLFRTMQVRVDAVNRVLREQITGVRVVRAFTREVHEQERFGERNAELTDTAWRVGRMMALLFPLVTAILNLSSVAVVWFGAHRMASGDLQVGQLTAFLSYLVQILMAVMMGSFIMLFAPRAAVSAERIQAVLGTQSSLHSPAEPRHPQRWTGQVELRGVDFSYPGADSAVLHDIDLEVRPGRTTAIIGSTGSGKSTLVNLVPRLFDVTAGSVAVDGIDVRELDLEELWSHLGLVPQKPFLFSGTIADNLRQAKPEATDDELWEALRIAQADDFVTELDEGLQTQVSQGGSNFSGGQRQRLSIARALVRRPQVYLFDDCFSALDVATDARLRAALKPQLGDSAVLLVAQRVSTIIDADEIVVLDHGHIVGRGRHDDLVLDCPTYAEIVESQLAGMEQGR